jgi:hypothetical protein
MLRSTLQAGSFAKIAHRAIFKRSALVVCRNSTPMTNLWSQPPFAQQRLLFFIAWPVVLNAKTHLINIF